MKYIVKEDKENNRYIIFDSKCLTIGSCTSMVYERNKDYILSLTSKFCGVELKFILNGLEIYKLRLYDYTTEQDYNKYITAYASKAELEELVKEYKLFDTVILKMPRKIKIVKDKLIEDDIPYNINNVAKDSVMIRALSRDREFLWFVFFCNGSKEYGVVSIEEFKNCYKDFESSIIEHDKFIEVLTNPRILMQKGKEETLRTKITVRSQLCNKTINVIGNTIEVDLLHDDIKVIPNGIMHITFMPHMQTIISGIKDNLISKDEITVKSLFIPDTYLDKLYINTFSNGKSLQKGKNNILSFITEST